MKTYSVPVTFSFSGVFLIRASSLTEAKELIDLHCGLVLGGDIHSTLDDESVEWDFPRHPNKKIGHRSVS
ncbi:MAG: hypothetical protein KJ900_05195 [Proteobacteria bacterium]|jgi:hypothetical protein|nr:hypothetical protein [Desulfocapsa sp.]MBU3944335.1 hypothetical protein [Pseudomonadota bacterium]MCG2745848.1 hypothetical protein [Desulfobacteraceae bacterium]MDO8948374.1 hypothetical protein [Desulfocapsaceae bacterium]MBU4029815.1 hypothetical protein [Pseudomonadota bacterium]